MMYNVIFVICICFFLSLIWKIHFKKLFAIQIFAGLTRVSHRARLIISKFFLIVDNSTKWNFRDVIITANCPCLDKQIITKLKEIEGYKWTFFSSRNKVYNVIYTQIRACQQTNVNSIWGNKCEIFVEVIHVM